MRVIVAAIAALFLAHHACAADNDFRDTTDKALAAGTPAAVVSALEREIYRGNLIAAEALGLMYRDGRIVPRDPAKARKLLKTASTGDGIRLWFRRGIADAQFALAVMLRDGVGGKPEPADARGWFEEAAEQGYGPAQLALANMYASGAGIPQDPERAYIWASVAASTLGEAEQQQGELIRSDVQRRLNPKQRQEADKLVAGWKARR